MNNKLPQIGDVVLVDDPRIGPEFLQITNLHIEIFSGDRKIPISFIREIICPIEAQRNLDANEK